MRVKGTDCNGCPECINCGKGGWYYYHKCDKCGSTEQLYIWHSDELCAECLLEEFDEVDMEE